MSELPLFPLQTVLLPDGRFALRVFEARYRRHGRAVPARRESFRRRRDPRRRRGRGRDDVRLRHERRDRRLAPGARRFARHPRGRPRRRFACSRPARARRPVRRRASPGSRRCRRGRCRPCTSRSQRCCERLIEPLPLYRGVAPSFDDAVWVAARLIELLPLALAFKQSLLEMPDAGAASRASGRGAAVRPRGRVRRWLVVGLPAKKHRAFGG